jgi:CO dehydrogenase nickel-insertion accessory protein CooC1
MVLVSDASNAGLETLTRLYELAKELKMDYRRLVLIVNRIRGGKMPARMEEIKAATHADLVIGLPNDETVAQFAEESRSFLLLPEENPVYTKIKELI